MKKVIDPGFEKKTINLIDNVVYSHVTDLEGNPLELKLSVMLQNGNSEQRLAINEDDPREDHSPKPALVWIPGGGYRGADKNLMLGEMSEFARAGYVVVSIYYRSSAQGKWPAQIQDVKTAIRFLRANAAKYEVDPDRIGVFGRSAGGHLATFAALNTDGYDTEEWAGYSSKVQAAINMFGSTDTTALMKSEMARFSDPNFRWHKVEDTHGGALLGGDPNTMLERSALDNPLNYINPGMAPLQILHGDNDPICPIELTSEPLYEKMVAAGLGGQTDFYIVKHAGHGSREFFQDSVKELMIAFFDKYLKN